MNPPPVAVAPALAATLPPIFITALPVISTWCLLKLDAIIRFPVIVTVPFVPILIITSLPSLPLVCIVKSPPQFNIPSTLIVRFLPLVVAEPNVILPLTVSVTPALIVNTLDAVGFPVQDMLAQEVLVVTVIVALVLITTSSPGPGGTPPTQVPPAFQLPVTLFEVIVAAYKQVLYKNKNTATKFIR